jgi:hypothetical protein
VEKPAVVQLLKNFASFSKLHCGSYPEPDGSSPRRILTFQDPPTYVLVLLAISFIPSFPSIFFLHSSSVSFVLHASRTRSFPITSYEAPHYAALSSLLPLQTFKYSGVLDGSLRKFAGNERVMFMTFGCSISNCSKHISDSSDRKLMHFPNCFRYKHDDLKAARILVKFLLQTYQP